MKKYLCLIFSLFALFFFGCSDLENQGSMTVDLSRVISSARFQDAINADGDDADSPMAGTNPRITIRVSLTFSDDKTDVQEASFFANGTNGNKKAEFTFEKLIIGERVVVSVEILHGTKVIATGTKSVEIARNTPCNVSLTLAKEKHTYSEEWTSNASDHWHVCEVEGCEEVSEKAEHSFSEWTIEKEATETATGLKKRVCSVCNYEAVEAIPSLSHEHSWAKEWTFDETNHWHVCVGDGCEEVSEKAEHSWNEGVVTKEPSVALKGEKTYTCTVCGKTKVEEIIASGTISTNVGALNFDDVTITLSGGMTAIINGSEKTSFTVKEVLDSKEYKESDAIFMNINSENNEISIVWTNENHSATLNGSEVVNGAKILISDNIIKSDNNTLVFKTSGGEHRLSTVLNFMFN